MIPGTSTYGHRRRPGCNGRSKLLYLSEFRKTAKSWMFRCSVILVRSQLTARKDKNHEEISEALFTCLGIGALHQPQRPRIRRGPLPVVTATKASTTAAATAATAARSNNGPRSRPQPCPQRICTAGRNIDRSPLSTLQAVTINSSRHCGHTRRVSICSLHPCCTSFIGPCCLGPISEANCE
jgi:hypothetical protein